MTHNHLKLIELIESEDSQFLRDVQNARVKLGFNEPFVSMEEFISWNTDWFRFGKQPVDKETVIETSESITELEGQYVTSKQIHDAAREVLFKYNRNADDGTLHAITNFILCGNLEFTRNKEPITLRYYPSPVNRISFDITKETSRDDLIPSFWNKNESTILKLQKFCRAGISDKKIKPEIMVALDKVNQYIRILINAGVKKTHLHDQWSKKIRPLQKKLYGFQEKYRPYNVKVHIAIRKSEQYKYENTTLKHLQEEVESRTGKRISKNTIRTIRRLKRKEPST